MRKVRRKDREIGTNEAIALLSNCLYGVLSTVDKEGQPYGVPLGYVYKNNSIYFHCAQGGHKIENIETALRFHFAS